MKLVKRVSDSVAAFDDLPFAQRLGWRLLVGSIVLSVITITAWNASGLGPAERGAAQAYRDLEAEGTPLSAEGFERSFAVPDDQNSAAELMPALVKLREKSGTLTQDEKAVTEWKSAQLSKTEPTNAQTTRVLKIIEPSLAAVKASARKPYFVPKKDWRAPEQALFPEYADLRAAAKLLAFSARHHARSRNSERAKEDLSALRQIAMYAGDTPTLIGYLVEIACHSIGLAAVQGCVQDDPTHATQYSSVFNESDLPPFGRYLRGEAYFSFGTIRNLTTRDLIQYFSDPMTMFFGEEPRPIGRTSGLPSDPIVRAMAGRLLARQRELLRSIGPDHHEVRPGALEAAAKKAESDFEQGPAALLAELLVPVLSKAVAAGTRTQATHRVGKALARVVAHHQTHGSWPKSLAEAGVSAEDPFNSKKPLQYRVSKGDIRIWSLGPDKVDQGGVTQSEVPVQSSSQSYDVVAVFRLTR